MSDFNFDERMRECLALAEERLKEHRALGRKATDLERSIRSLRRQLNKGGRGGDG